MRLDDFSQDSLARAVLEALPFSVSVIAIPGGRILLANQVFLKTFGYAAGRFRTAGAFIEEAYISEKHRELCRGYWKHFAPAADEQGVIGIPDIEVDILCADGTLCSALHTGVLVPSQGFGIALYKDVSQLKQERRLLRQYAFVDPLTGLANRRAFQERWRDESLRAAHGQIALLMVDLDGFKPINDNHGHHAGDEALRIIARRIKQSVREGDLVCRFGGDEFAILMGAPGGAAHAEVVCRRLVASISEPMCIDGVIVSVTASIGGAIYPDHADDVRQLLQRADLAMYLAKKSGKAGWRWWAPGLHPDG